MYFRVTNRFQNHVMTCLKFNILNVTLRIITNCFQIYVMTYLKFNILNSQPTANLFGCST